MKYGLLLVVLLATASRGLAYAREVLPLAGKWRFALDPAAEQTRLNADRPLPTGDGVTQRWYERDLEGRIQLPGILQAQGFGNDITPGTPWVLTLGDAWWKLQPAKLRERFSQPGQVEVPFLAQPPKHYLGVAWYQRDVDIALSWQGRHVTLFLERPHWETTVWVDGRECGSDRSLVGPHVHDLGSLAPGRHRLTIRVDNRRIIVDPHNDEHALDAHSVSDALGASWNGIVGRIELIATSAVWIEDAQIFPNPATKSAMVNVRMGNSSGVAGIGKLSAAGVSVDVAWTPEGGQAQLTFPLEENVRTWDEFHPNLQHVEVVLKGQAANDAVIVRYGIRDISWNDKELILNQRSINLRTTHFGGDFPLTGYPATDPESWKKIFRVCKDYGMNGMRFHSWCPPDAAFTAADELGFYLQPECGMWSPFSPGSIYTQLLETETARIRQFYGNHPSFILLSPGNEPGGHYVAVTPEWAERNYRQDARRLYSAGTGWSNPAQVKGGAQYATLVRFPGGELRNTTGWFGNDYRNALRDVHIPVFAHEIGQWCAYPDFDVATKFRGYLRPGNYHIFREIADEQGTLAENKELAHASGRFQLACYKEEIEANLRTPGLAGYQLLDLHDYLGQGTALIGLLDAFWGSKGYATPEEFRRFNSATVPLVRLAKRVFTTAETLTAETEMYHFGDVPLDEATAYWKIVGSDGRVVLASEWSTRKIPIGKNIELGKITADLSKLAAPECYKLVAGLRGQAVENDWNFWLYPERANSAPSAGVLETSDWNEAERGLATGAKVLFIPTHDGLDSLRCPAMKQVPVFWNIQMTVRPPRNPTPKFDAFLGLLCEPAHPALALFPTGPNCDWQWTPLINDVRAINLSEAPRELKPIVAAIDDWNRGWRLGVIFECKVGSGKLLVSAIPVAGDSVSASTRQLRRSLLDYASSDLFDPKTEMSAGEVRKLWREGSTPVPDRPARVFDPDLNDGTIQRTPTSDS